MDFPYQQQMAHYLVVPDNAQRDQNQFHFVGNVFHTIVADKPTISHETFDSQPRDVHLDGSRVQHLHVGYRQPI